MKKAKINIPEDWSINKLGEICLIKGEYGINAAAVDYDINLPTYLRITDIDGQGNYIRKKQKSVNDSNYKKYILKENDIVYARTGATVGKSYLHHNKNGELVFAGFLIRFRTNPNILTAHYLKRYSESSQYWDWVKVFSMRSGQPGLNGKEYSQMNILLPPLPEQKKIAKILSTWDNAIETTSKLIQAKQKQKKGLLHKLICNPADIIKIENQKLGDFLKLNLHKTDKPRNNYLALGLRSHGKGIFHKQNIDPKSNAMTSLYGVKEDELIVNITFAWEGAIAIVKKEDEGGLVSHRFPSYVFNKDVAIHEYFKYVIITERFKYYLGLISPGGAGRNRVMSKKDFLKIKWPIPPVKEQKKIASILSTADKEIEHLQSYLAKLQEQKKGLMQQLLTGKKRVITD